MDKATAAPAAKMPRYDIDYLRCIICQTETEEELVIVPTSHEKVLNLIREHAGYGDGNFPEISRRRGNVTHHTLDLHSATWHRKCYQDTIHVGMCKRAKERYKKKLSLKCDMETLSSQSVSESVAFTRSVTQSAPKLRSCVSSVKRREQTLTLFTRLPLQVLAKLSRKPSRKLRMTHFM